MGELGFGGIMTSARNSLPKGIKTYIERRLLLAISRRR
jgi:hypothetical protein